MTLRDIQCDGLALTTARLRFITLTHLEVDMAYKQEVRIEIRIGGILHNMCEGSVAQSIAFLKALEKEQKDALKESK